MKSVISLIAFRIHPQISSNNCRKNKILSVGWKKSWYLSNGYKKKWEFHQEITEKKNVNFVEQSQKNK